jgi:hypothetical protein
MDDRLWFVIDVRIQSERLECAAEGLTAAQLDIRRRNERLPKHLKRSLDAYRVALGMIPLWGFDSSCPAHELPALCRRRELNRRSQQRCRERKRKATDGTQG